MTKLSIIVPVYNVERYIRPCIESIFRQGLNEADFEVIIVNDGTPDKSMELITDIIGQHQNITVINQENQGLSVARNNAIKVATGKYIQFLDSDDLLIDNTLPYLLNNAISSKAELVIGDFIEMNDESIVDNYLESIHQFDGTIQKINGKDLLAQPLCSGYSCAWRTIYRKEFLDKNNIRFIPGIYFEDVPFTNHCFLKAQKCLRVKWLILIYRKRPQSIMTSIFTKKKGMDYCVIIKKMWELSQEKELDVRLKNKIKDDIFSLFSVLLYLTTSCKAITRSEKMEILYHIKQLVPDLYFNNSCKQRIVSFLYQKRPNTYMTLRIFYANHLQYICWAIGDYIRHRKQNKLL